MTVAVTTAAAMVMMTTRTMVVMAVTLMVVLTTVPALRGNTTKTKRTSSRLATTCVRVCGAGAPPP